MIHLHTLGEIDLRDAEGRPVTRVLAQPKRLALLVHLALAPNGGFRRRDTLLGVFWPDLDPPHARNALSQALYKLREHLGQGVIVARGDEEIGVDRRCLDCDAVRVLAAAGAGRAEEALAGYRGELLPGFFLSSAPEFDR